MTNQEQERDDLEFYIEAFGVPIKSGRANVSEEWRKGLIEKIDEKYDMSSHTIFFGDDLERREDFYDMEPLYKNISEDIKELLSNFIKNDKLELYDFHIVKWWNVTMKTGGFVNPHTHTDSHISGVYYVEVPETNSMGGEFCLVDKSNASATAWQLPIHSDHFFGPYQYRIPPTTNQILLFPSNQPHAVLPYSGDKKRYSISFDIVITRNNVPDPQHFGGFENTLPEPKYWKKLT